MKTLSQIVGDYETFLISILKEIEDEGFDLNDFMQIDHICYRVTSMDDYTAKKQELEEVAEFLGETMVNNRPIATYRLVEPIVHGKWRIDAVELPAPKPDADFAEGLQHIEMVMYDSKEKFIQKYKHKALKLKAADRGINPEIGFDLPNYVVKFHLLNLPTVIYLQNKLGITEV
jgi:predicted metalloenzyme YecM